MTQIASTPDLRARRSERGFAMIEVMISATVLVIAILGHMSAVVGGHRFSQNTTDRGMAVETLGRFIERIRADADWAGLYARLRPLSSESATDATLARLGADKNLVTKTAATYYPDFTLPTSLGTVTFLVQVPSTLDVNGLAGLRENAAAPRYGLPYDLNGDGVIDGAARDADYRALPVVVRIRWQRAGQASEEAVIATYLRGDR